MLKTVLFIAFVGHILCGICDYSVCYGHNRNDIASSVGMRVKYTAADVTFGTYTTSC